MYTCTHYKLFPCRAPGPPAGSRRGRAAGCGPRQSPRILLLLLLPLLLLLLLLFILYHYGINIIIVIIIIIIIITILLRYYYYLSLISLSLLCMSYIILPRPSAPPAAAPQAPILPVYC